MALTSLASTTLAQSPLFETGARVLFQGDSITDMGRGRTEDPNHLLGHGYAFIICAREGADFPERQPTFLNRGIGGNTSVDLAARWKADTLDLKPDVLSVLIGVNDVGHALRDHQTFSVEEFEKRYDQLLADTLAACPGVKFILGEPFFSTAKGPPEDTEQWKAIMPRMREAVARLGEKYHAPVVHYQADVRRSAKTRAPHLLDLGSGPPDLCRPPTHGGRMEANLPRVLRSSEALSACQLMAAAFAVAAAATGAGCADGQSHHSALVTPRG